MVAELDLEELQRPEFSAALVPAMKHGRSNNAAPPIQLSPRMRRGCCRQLAQQKEVQLSNNPPGPRSTLRSAAVLPK